MTKFNNNCLVYDGACPICRTFARVAQDKSPTSFTLMDARQPTALVADLEEIGVDLDKAVVLALDGQRFIGSEAVQKICLESNNLFLQYVVGRFLFRYTWSAKCTYLFFKRCRSVQLFLMKIPLIRNR